MPTTIPNPARYTETKGTADQIGKPGFVSAYKLDPKTGRPAGDLSLGSEAKPPKTPAAPAPTGAPAGESALDKATREYYQGLNTAMPSKSKAYEDALKQMQGVIDAIDLQYKTLTDEQTRTGNLALDRNRAIQSRSGLRGSTFGEAQTGEVTAQNMRAQKLLQQEKQAKISEVFAMAQSKADERYKAEREEALGNQKAYLDYLAGVQEKAKTGVKTLAAGGVSLTELSSDQYQKLLKDSGLDEFTFKAYYNANKPAEAQTKYQYEVQGSKIIAYGVDPATGKLEMTSTDLPEGAASGKYKEQVMPDGTLLLIPENFDPSKPLDGQIIKAGRYSSPTSTANGTKQGAIEKARTIVEGSRGTDGYADPATYMRERSTYAAAVGSVAGFDDVFSPMLSPKERARLGVGKSVGLTADEPAEAEKFITPEYLGKLFPKEALEAAAKEAGYGKDTAKYLAYLNGVVEQYRAAGYTDKEIIEKMQQ